MLTTAPCCRKKPSRLNPNKMREGIIMYAFKMLKSENKAIMVIRLVLHPPKATAAASAAARGEAATFSTGNTYNMAALIKT